MACVGSSEKDGTETRFDAARFVVLHAGLSVGCAAGGAWGPHPALVHSDWRLRNIWPGLVSRRGWLSGYSGCRARNQPPGPQKGLEHGSEMAGMCKVYHPPPSVLPVRPSLVFCHGPGLRVCVRAVG